jgi:hypothetical protein
MGLNCVQRISSSNYTIMAKIQDMDFVKRRQFFDRFIHKELFLSFHIIMLLIKSEDLIGFYVMKKKNNQRNLAAYQYHTQSYERSSKMNSYYWLLISMKNWFISHRINHRSLYNVDHR